MKTTTWRGGLALVLAFGMAGAASAQPDPIAWLSGRETAQVQVQHAAVRLIVMAEPRRDISVTVQHGASRLPPIIVRREGGRIVLDGGLERPGGGERIDCRGGLSRGPSGASDQRAVVVGGYGRTPYGDLPLITAHLPLDAQVAGDGAVYGQVSASRSLAIVASGCGDWTAGPVRGRLDAKFSGSGDLRAGDAGSLQAAVSGSSDVSLGHVANGASVTLAGSGDLNADAISGPLQARVAGSGDLTAGRQDGSVHADIAGSGGVRLKGGHAPDVDVRVSGSGEFNFAGEAGRVVAVASGSGDIRIAAATGPVSRISTGSAEIDIGR